MRERVPNDSRREGEKEVVLVGWGMGTGSNGG